MLPQDKPPAPTRQETAYHWYSRLLLPRWFKVDDVATPLGFGFDGLPESVAGDEAFDRVVGAGGKEDDRVAGEALQGVRHRRHAVFGDPS